MKTRRAGQGMDGTIAIVPYKIQTNHVGAIINRPLNICHVRQTFGPPAKHTPRLHIFNRLANMLSLPEETGRATGDGRPYRV